MSDDDDQNIEYESWWEIRSVKHKGFLVDAKDWAEIHDDTLKDEIYKTPEAAAEDYFQKVKTDTEQAALDDTYGGCWLIDVQKVQEALSLDGKRVISVDVVGECCSYYITQRWSMKNQRMDVEFQDADKIEQIFERERELVEIEEIFREEGVGVPPRRRRGHTLDAKPSNAPEQEDTEEDLSPEIER